MTPNLLAVYGILKRGHCADLQERGCKFLGQATLPGSLYRIGGGVGLRLPSASALTSADAQVEVFEIPDRLWGWLDGIENHPYTYERKVVTVYSTDPETPPMKAWIYEHQHPRYFERRIASGNYTGTEADLA